MEPFAIITALTLTFTRIPVQRLQLLIPKAPNIRSFATTYLETGSSASKPPLTIMSEQNSHSPLPALPRSPLEYSSSSFSTTTARRSFPATVPERPDLPPPPSMDVVGAPPPPVPGATGKYQLATSPREGWRKEEQKHH
jgi:hypothetical protein